jgi:hypothetical protein
MPMRMRVLRSLEADLAARSLPPARLGGPAAAGAAAARRVDVIWNLQPVAPGVFAFL